MHIARVTDAAALAEVRALFEEYAASLGFSLDFQGFAEELASLPGRYAPPEGVLLLAPGAGCVALRRISAPGASCCEMKRLYVRPAFQGRGLGRALVRAIVAEGRALGYAAMRLDTVPAMSSAIRLYESLDFHDIEPYTTNPVPGARFMELRL